MRSKCDACGSPDLVKLSTCKHPNFHKPGYMVCANCNHEMPWHLDDKQKPLVANNRATTKPKLE